MNLKPSKLFKLKFPLWNVKKSYLYFRIGNLQWIKNVILKAIFQITLLPGHYSLIYNTANVNDVTFPNNPTYS
jgi:hypothetical protein